MNWRPKEGWNNPYGDDKVKDYDLSRGIAIMKDGSCIDEIARKALRDRYEAGADAIVEALKADAEYLHNTGTMPYGYVLGKSLKLGEKGWLVLIPDEGITKAPYELTLSNKLAVRDKKSGEVSTLKLLSISGEQ